jgi:hypothetical protein
MRRLFDRQWQLPACHEASCWQTATACLSWCVLLTGRGNCLPVLMRLLTGRITAYPDASCWQAKATACLSWGVFLTGRGNCLPVLMRLLAGKGNCPPVIRRLACRERQLTTCHEACCWQAKTAVCLSWGVLLTGRGKQLPACHKAFCWQAEATARLSLGILLTGRGNCLPILMRLLTGKGNLLPVMRRVADRQRQLPACYEAFCWQAEATARLSLGILLTGRGNCLPILMRLLTGKGNFLPVMRRVADRQRQLPACHEASCWRLMATANLTWCW